MKTALRQLSLTCLLIMAGCRGAQLDPRPVFGQVGQDVIGRTGRAIQWRTHSEEDAAVEATVREMLKQPLGVNQAVQIALLNNPRIQGTYEELGVAQARLVQAGLLNNPVFDLQLRFAEGPGDDYILEMGVIKNFLDVLFLGIRKDIARAELEITKSQVTGQVLSLAARTQTAFYVYQASLQTYEANRQIVAAAEASSDAAQRLHVAGNITDLALATERSLYEQAKIEAAASEAVMLRNRERLNVWMGLWGADTVWETVATLPDMPPEQMDMTDLEGRAVGSSLDLLVVRQTMGMVAARTGVETANLVFPQSGVGADAERESDGTWSVGPQVALGIPIFDFGQARMAVGRARLRRLWDEYTAMAINIRAAARSARYRVLNARRQADYYKRVLVPLAESITLETQLQYNAMQIGIFQLLDAKRREIDFRRRYIVSLRDYWIARTEIELLLNGRFTGQMMTDAPIAGDMTMQPMDSAPGLRQGD